MNRNQFREYLLAGTVTFPGTFPRIADLQLRRMPQPTLSQSPAGGIFLAATEHPSPRVSLTRRVNIKHVRAVFLPCNRARIDWEDGRWLLGDEVLVGLELGLANQPSISGIVFVPETAPAHLEMTAGMTAGESIQYYPPMPRDPANDHYCTAPPAQGPPTHGPPNDPYHHSVRQTRAFFPCEDSDHHVRGTYPASREMPSKSVCDPFLQKQSASFPCE